MPVESRSDVEEMQHVQNEAGNRVPPASGEFVHEFGTAVDVGAATESVTVSMPDRARSLTTHVAGWDGSGHVEVEFQAADGTPLTVRDHQDVSAYGTDGSSEVFVTVDAAAPLVEVRIVDDSGATNEVSYSIYAR